MNTYPSYLPPSIAAVATAVSMFLIVSTPCSSQNVFVDTIVAPTCFWYSAEVKDTTYDLVVRLFRPDSVEVLYVERDSRGISRTFHGFGEVGAHAEPVGLGSDETLPAYVITLEHRNQDSPLYSSLFLSYVSSSPSSTSGAQRSSPSFGCLGQVLWYVGGVDQYLTPTLINKQCDPPPH